jgi:hypothetical protein
MAHFQKEGLFRIPGLFHQMARDSEATREECRGEIPSPANRAIQAGLAAHQAVHR